MTERLAIYGGNPLIPKGSEKRWPVIPDEDIEEVKKVLESRVLFGVHAPQVKSLEKEWADYVGVKYCVAVNSGTAGLHAAVAAAGVGPGDEVITSPFTFLSSASSVLHHNGIPVFADIDPETYNIDPERIKEKITEKTKAIIPVHIHGLPADMEEINKIAKDNKLIVIEDACQAHGAEYKGRKTGRLGDMAAFSMQESKNLPAIDGGLFTTDSDEYREKAEMVRMFGEVVEPGKKRAYNAYTLGWMYRTNELISALARCQLKRLDANNDIRIKFGKYISRELNKIPGVIPPYVPHDRTHVYHIFRVRLDPKAAGVNMKPRDFRLKVQKALQAEGVGCGEWLSAPLTEQELFRVKEGYGKGCPWTCPHHGGADVRYSAEDYPEAVKLIDGSFIIGGIHPPNTMELMELIIESFRKVFSQLDEVMKVKVEE